MKRVLVLKGGGARGIIQLEALKVYETYFKMKISEFFDLIVGTSVGAISGGILATGKISVEKYLNQSIEFILKVFQKKKIWKRIFSTIYDKNNFYVMWDKILGKKTIFMKECKTKFMCSAVNLCDNRTHFFKSWEKKDGETILADQIVKSFAAPHYFGQFVDEINRTVWVDGGAGGTNTPLEMAYAETINQGWYKERVEIIVIGTGMDDLCIPFEKARKLGQLGQILSFMKLRKGGLARVQSTINKINWMHIIAKSNPLLTFKYFDTPIEKKYSGIDKIKYLDKYMEFGKVIAKLVEKDLKEYKMPYF